ncbi:CRISPR-associated endonuclease Cas6 [Nitrosopumilus sp.]|uniref:CRISPR-associated endonuclease Cas6 n=1 Tax=Nitrosopumilus sp. TaxID=2024843 RepID=UPI00349FF868
MDDKKIKICRAMLDFDSEQNVTPIQLRGFLAHLFTNISEFHHHSDNSYHYPLIQYKRIDKKLAVIGLGEFADVVFDKMSNLDHITTQDQKISLTNIELQNMVYYPKEIKSKYKFASPWIALNKENYTKYSLLVKKDQRQFLEKILVGNILSMLKGMKIFVDYMITVKIVQYKSITITAHKNKFAGFFCNWDSNITIPEYCGLGKSISKGFGDVLVLK